MELTTRGKLEHKLLETNGVYLIDCLGEVFIWIGKQSTRLVRAAALKLAHELTALITRPTFAVVTKISEGNIFMSRTMVLIWVSYLEVGYPIFIFYFSFNFI